MPFEITAALIVALAFFLQRITGFGSAVIATPVLALLWQPHESIALLLIYQTLFGLILIGRVWRRLLALEVRWFQIVFLPAVIIGAYLLPSLESEIVRRCLAVLCGLVLIQWLFIPKFGLAEKWQAVAGGGCGLMSGMVQGTLGMGGPFFLLFYSSVEDRTELIRDTAIAVFCVANVIRLPVALVTAQFTQGVLTAALFAALPFALAMFLGAKLSERINATVFRYIAAAILLIAASQLILT